MGAGLGALSTPHSGKDPDKEAKTAIPALKALQGREPGTGKNPMESWKQASPWCRGKSLDGDLEGLVTSQLSLASHVILRTSVSTL